MLLYLVSVVLVVAGVAPGDEDPLCQQLRANGTAPMPSYAASIRVLLDSWNYENLLPPHSGAVWTEVHIEDDSLDVVSDIDSQDGDSDGAGTRVRTKVLPLQNNSMNMSILSNCH